jgi:hypothetical protein
MLYDAIVRQKKPKVKPPEKTGQERMDRMAADNRHELPDALRLFMKGLP